ncbi:MAG TPA: acetyl-CoA hydrolase/transferase C-terminal domain-containing protein [Gammaproteobacteria bacterium]|nr:acetyl-CoA hydrolase/transferase C-terminal domain-containing protein [Gammaproteobacteria bacterium]
MSYTAEYQAKLLNPDQAVQLLPKRGNLSMGMAVSEPPELLKALERRLKSTGSDAVEQLNVYYMHSEQASRETIFKYEYMDRIRPHSFFIGATERALLAKGKLENKKTVYYVPGNFSSVPNILAEIGIEAFILMVSPMDKSGLFSCGTNNDYTLLTARSAKTLIVEVNPHMPRVYGDSCLHISEIDAIVESANPLPETYAKPITELDQKISQLIITLIPDRATLQVGIGGVPNAVCQALHHHRGLGLHTELISNGLIDLLQSGAITNKYKNINQYKNVYTFARGDKYVYDFLNHNASMEIYPVNYVNNPLVISQNDNVISINGFLEIDFAGQVNAESIGKRQYSAPGGQLDFIRGAQLSKNGKSILAAYSTAQNASISRIVPYLEGPTTDPRADIQYVVTEYGIANLRGKSVTERTLALIEIAHPTFRTALMEQAKNLGFI